MSVHHGDPRDFPAGDPSPGCCTCGHATHVGDSPPPCRCFRPALGPPYLDPAAALTGGTVVRMPAEPKRPLHADIVALADRFAESGATSMEYEYGGWRVVLTRAADGSAFSLTMVRA